MATAHAALGLVRFGDDWDWNAAEAHFRRALDIDPDLASARVHYSWLLMLLGREGAALAEANRAVSTWHARFVVTGAALTYFLAERYDEAIALCNECLDASPDYLFAIYQRGQCYHMKGMYPTAHAELERAAQIGQRAPFYTALLGKSYGEAGMRDKALAIVKEFDEMQRRRYVAPHCYVLRLSTGSANASARSSIRRTPTVTAVSRSITCRRSSGICSRSTRRTAIGCARCA